MSQSKDFNTLLDLHWVAELLTMVQKHSAEKIIKAQFYQCPI